MVIADSNFHSHVNVMIYTVLRRVVRGRCFRFQSDPSTEGKCCLMLPNVREFSIVTSCPMVKKYIFVQLTLNRII